MDAKLLEMLIKAACENEPDDVMAAPCCEKLQIVALQRGFVVVGMVSQSGTTVTVSGGSFVRRWGTTKGLGELAGRGPLENTKLDPFAFTLEVHERDVVFRLGCNSEAWGGRHVG